MPALKRTQNCQYKYEDFFFRKIGNLLNWLTLSYTYAMPERITPQLEPSS